MNLLSSEINSILYDLDDIKVKSLKLLKHIKTNNDDINNKTVNGSTRKVFFLKENTNIVLDNKIVNLPTVIKIAYEGCFDDITGVDLLLGEIQNESEINCSKSQYGILIPSDKGYIFNPEGVFNNVITHHKLHWVEAIKLKPLLAMSFPKLTKTKSIPAGLDYDVFSRVLLVEAALRKGIVPKYTKSLYHDKYLEHYLVKNILAFTLEHSLAMNDIAHVIHNWGIFTHPITNKQYPIILDYGCNTNINDLFKRSRDEMLNSW